MAEQAEWGALALEVIPVPNDGTMSDQPTNATIVGTAEVYIVDPGDTAGVELMQAALARRGDVRVKAILLTHAHPDHVRAVPELRRLLGCPVLMHPAEEPIARQFFDPALVDGPLTGGMTFDLPGGRLEALDTPGHTPGHVALLDPAAHTLIAGDLVAGHGTVGIFPPHGRMRQYFDSLARMQRVDIRRIIPGHGDILTQPPDIFGQYIARRTTRENDILGVVRRGPTTIEAVLPELYPDVLPQFRRAAAATILAHLEKLREEGRVVQSGDDPREAQWRATDAG